MLKKHGWRLPVRLVSVGVSIIVFLLGVTRSAIAHSWSHYRRIWNASNDRYGGYAWLDADERVDFIHVKFRVADTQNDDTIRSEEVYCGPAQEACGYRRTTSTFWTKRTRWIQHVHCGYDRTPAGYVHKFVGSGNDLARGWLYEPCTSNSVWPHVHDYYYP